MNAQPQQKTATNTNIIQLRSAPPVDKSVLSAAKAGIPQVLDLALNESQRQHIQAGLNVDVPITVAAGDAGNGRTFISVLCALYLLNHHVVDKIIISRPAITAGEDIGFLPGDIDDKLGPFAAPMYDALRLFNISEKLIEERVEIIPLAFMRGRTFRNSAVICDEFQNTTPEQMKMALTRLGAGSYMFVNGDVTQCDLPHRRQPDGTWQQPPSGLTDLRKRLQKKCETPISDIGLHDCGHHINMVQYNPAHIVRHDAVADVIDLYAK